jgi:hypothetical protein
VEKERKDMKQKYDGRVNRTSGWRSQPLFDKILSDLDVSSLRFLKSDYNKKIRDFGNHGDLHNEDNVKQYQILLQKKRMVTEELENRKRDIDAIPKYLEGETYYDSDSGLVINTEKGPLYGIAFNEDETGYVYHHIDGDAVSEDIPQDDYEDDLDKDDVYIIPIKEGNKVVGYKVKESDRELKDIYSGWNYYEESND